MRSFKRFKLALQISQNISLKISLFFSWAGSISSLPRAVCPISVASKFSPTSLLWACVTPPSLSPSVTDLSPFPDLLPHQFAWYLWAPWFAASGQLHRQCPFFLQRKQWSQSLGGKHPVSSAASLTSWVAALIPATSWRTCHSVVHGESSHVQIFLDLFFLLPSSSAATVVGQIRQVCFVRTTHVGLLDCLSDEWRSPFRILSQRSSVGV